MPYPAKLSQAAILQCAIRMIEVQGPEGLSLRAIAAELGVAPNALYRYYPDRAALEDGIANAAAEQLRSTIDAASRGKSGKEAILAAGKAYRSFAIEHRAIYQLLMRTTNTPPAHLALWASIVQLIAATAGARRAPEAAVALWGYLHGMVEMERAEVIGAPKPESGFLYGLECLLSGMSSSG